VRKQAGWRVVTVIAAVGLVAAACGGGSGKKATSNTTATTASESSSTLDTTATTATGAESATSTTAAAGTTGGTTTTTAKKSTATTAKKNALSNATAPKNIGGIAQVTTTASTAPAEPPQPGGTLTVELAAEGNGFDPSFSTGSIGGTDPLKLFAVFDGLVYADGTSGSIVPQTAESMTTSDAITWKLKIRPGIKFTDDTNYDAAAVVYNWNRCRDDASLACSQAPTLKTWNYSVVNGDPLSMTITLPSANGQFPRIISIGGGGLSAIASPTWLNGKTRDAVLNSKPVGAGPFTLDNWVKDSSLTLVRNPKYWNQPKPYIDRLVFKPVTDDQQRANSFKAGEADVIFMSNPAFIPDLQKTFPVTSVPSINSSIYIMQTGKGPFADINLRKAIELVIDRDQINQTVFGGVLDSVKGYFPANLPYSDPSLQFPAKNIAQAQTLVDNWIATKNGGKDLVFNWSASNSGVSPQVAQLVQQQVQQLKHVTMNLKLQSTVQNTNDIRANSFDIISTVYTGVDPEPQVFQQLQTGGARGPVYTGYSNSQIDAAITASRAATDANSRNNALKDMQRAALADVPILVLYRTPYFYAYKSNIKDLQFFDEGGILSDRLWIKSHG
jgi:peptide/nickel transport system substrate-binding protein